MVDINLSGARNRGYSFFFQAEDGIRDYKVTGVQTCALPILSLGHGALFAFGAYASALLTTRAGVPVWIAIFLSGAVAGLVGFLIALPTLRARGHYLAMVTIALAIVTFVVAQTWLAVTNGPTGIGNIPRPEWFGTTMGALRK